MAQFTPQFSLYKTIGIIKTFGKAMFWVIFALSFCPILANKIVELKQLEDVVNIANIVLIILFFIQEIVVESILIPMAESRRRNDFMDNSFGSRYSPNNSVGYFDNDSVVHGKYKAAVNLFQNCFFTYSLLKIATPGRAIVPGLVFVVVAILACLGFNKVPFALSVLQILFSTNVLGSLIKHFVLLIQIGYIQENWISLFQRADFIPTNTSYENDILRNWLQYETLISRLPADISDRIFNKHNANLTTEWLQIKSTYRIP